MNRATTLAEAQAHLRAAIRAQLAAERTAVLYLADGGVFVHTADGFVRCPFSSPMPGAGAPDYN